MFLSTFLLANNGYSYIQRCRAFTLNWQYVLLFSTFNFFFQFPTSKAQTYLCLGLLSANNLILGQWLHQLNQPARTETSGTLPIQPYIICQGDLAGGFIFANLVQMLPRLSPSVNHLQRLYYTHFTTFHPFKHWLSTSYI